MVESFVCPYCQIHAQMNLRSRNKDSTEIFGIYACENCNRINFKAEEWHIKGSNIIHGETLHQYPSSSEVVDESVPEDVAKMFQQGVRCVNNNAPDGAMTCFRKCLQKICNQKNADSSKDLWEQIDDVLQGRVVALSTEIRKWGNIGAHPDEIIDEPTIEQARQVQEFTDIVFQDEYIIPAKIEKSKKVREGKN